uniref:Polyprotein n=1 Tax=Cajanus cajan TaxID=3821 RepID=A0A151SWK6_CAJCA|nr:polyprotein [Cajanus cajan]
MIYKGSNSRHSKDGSTINIDLTKLDINSKIARPVYENNSNIKIEDDFDPTRSQILNTLTRQKTFNIDKKWINEDFNVDYNKPLREWYFSTFTTEEVVNFRTLYYSFMEDNEINIYFFDWFEKCSREHNIIKTPNTVSKPNRKTSQKKNITCWKCGRTGHFANKCKIQNKINELEIDESLKKTLIIIMINSESEESDSTSDEESNTEIIYQLEEEDSNSSQEDECCLGPELCTCTDCKTINMLTSEQTHTLIDLISQLEDEGIEKLRTQQLININQTSTSSTPPIDNNYLNLITTHKWHCTIKLLVKNDEFNLIALIDSGADINCLQEGIIPSKYYEKTSEKVLSANNSHMKINYKLSSAKISFWHRKKYEVSLPYIDNFDEKEYCKKEIQEYLDKGLIRNSKSPWSCSAFYVMNATKQERGAPRLVINYKPLNKVLKWIRYPLPNKQDLIKRLNHASIFSKFDMKSGYYQIGVKEEDKYKTAFNVPFGHYEWNVMSFGLKNAPSEYQEIMNDIFYPHMKFALISIS